MSISSILDRIHLWKIHILDQGFCDPANEVMGPCSEAEGSKRSWGPHEKYSKDGSQVKIPGLDKVQEGSQCKESLVSSTARS
jgi:hypothetical protein